MTRLSALTTALVLTLSMTAANPSFAFGVEREMKESGEKGGTAISVEREMKESGEKGGTTDINIGVGELQETNTAPKAKKGGNGEPTWKVEEAD